MLPVFNVLALVLCDLGASRSFMSDSFRKRLSLLESDDGIELKVSICSEKIIKMNDYVRGAKLEICGKKIGANLYVLEMKEL